MEFLVSLGDLGWAARAPSVEEEGRHSNPSRLESTEAAGNFSAPFKYLDSEMDGGAQGPEQPAQALVILRKSLRATKT